MTTPALEIKNLQAWYGESHVLHGVDMVVQPGEVVTLLGRNGAGRTSTLRAKCWSAICVPLPRLDMVMEKPDGVACVISVVVTSPRFQPASPKSW